MDDNDLFAEAVRWDEYDRALRENNRHVPTNADYFQTVFDGCLACATELAAGVVLYRGRIMPPDKETDTEPLPFSDVGMPPPHLARDQRVSPAGIPVFYAAFELDTVVAELRPWPLARLTLATFVTAGPFRVLDLRHSNERVREAPHVSYAAYMISRPVHQEDAFRYLGTQYLAERLKAAGVAGLLYDSKLKPAGTNVAMFSQSGLKPFSRMLRIVTSAKYETTTCVSVAIQTGRVSLRSDDDSAHEFLNQLRSDFLVEKYIGGINPDARDVAYMFTVREGDRRVGIVALVSSPVAESDTDIGFICAITENDRKGGLGTEACRAAISWVRSVGRWTRLIGCVQDGNDVSKRLLAKLGFQKHSSRSTLYGQHEDVFVLAI